jgi:DHA2 family methylenomycin A resistance protein-like MFS transporter
VLNAVRQTGGAIGVAVLGAIGGGGASIEGMRLAMLLSGGALLLGLVAAIVWIRQPGQ